MYMNIQRDIKRDAERVCVCVCSLIYVDQVLGV